MELLPGRSGGAARRRPWLSPRASSRATDAVPQTIGARRSELNGALHELDMSETDIWVFRARTIFQVACMADLRPAETEGHLRRMSAYCEILCRALGFSVEHCELTRLASQLHDVGNVAIPDRLLLKPGKLTPSEYEAIKPHAEAGYQALADRTSAVVQIGGMIARSHHERWNGSGYPNGLSGREIPLLGRLAAIADAFDALTSDRPYRSALPIPAAIEVMHAERGAAFDPQLIDHFLAALPEVEAAQRAYATQ